MIDVQPRRHTAALRRVSKMVLTVVLAIVIGSLLTDAFESDALADSPDVFGDLDATASLVGTSSRPRKDGQFRKVEPALPGYVFNLHGNTHNKQCKRITLDGQVRKTPLRTGRGVGLGLEARELTRKHGCDVNQVVMQGLEIIDSDEGNVVYLWGQAGAHSTDPANRDDATYGQSGLVKTSTLTSTTGVNTAKIPCKYFASEKKTFCNGAARSSSKPAPIKRTTDGSAWGVRVKPVAIEPELNHMDSKSKFAYNTFSNYGIQSIEINVTGRKPNVPILWSLFNRSGGGQVRAHATEDTVFYLANVNPLIQRAVPGIKDCPAGQVIRVRIQSEYKDRCKAVQSNGEVEFVFGYMFSGKQRIYGWIVSRHRVGSGAWISHFKDPLPWPNTAASLGATEYDPDAITGAPDEPDPEYFPDGVPGPDALDSLLEEPAFISVRPPATWSTGHGVGSNSQLLCDVNGDKRDDALVHFSSGGYAGRTYVALSNGSSYGGYSLWGQNFGISPISEIIPGDMNGDGRCDLVGFSTNGLWTATVSNGSSFQPRGTVMSSFGISSTKRFFADVDGDGLSDLVAFFSSNGSWLVARGNGVGFTNVGTWISGHGVGSNAQLLGDIDADGDADATVVFSTSGEWFVAPSTGSSFTYYSKWVSGLAPGSTRFFLSDQSGDGAADAVAYSATANWVVGQSTGANFATPQTMAINYGYTWLPMMGDANGDNNADPIVYVNGTWMVAPTIDTNPPSTVISSGPGAIPQEMEFTPSQPTFTFSSPSDRYVTFRCSIDGAAASACSSPVQFPASADGVHTFQVWAVDQSGNVDPVGASRRFSIDSMPPDTTASESQVAPDASGVDLLDSVADIDGDGDGDAVGTNEQGTKLEVALSSPAGLEPATEWADLTEGLGAPLTGDVDGDGRDDVAQLSSTGEWRVRTSSGVTLSGEQVWASELGQPNSTAMLEDINGDGLDDAVVVASDDRVWYVALSTGSSFDVTNVFVTSGLETSAVRLVGDVDGDGNADLVEVDGFGSAHVARFENGSFEQFQSWSQAGTEELLDFTLGDVNGDGKQDLISYSSVGEYKVALSNGAEFSPGSAIETPWAEHFGVGSSRKLVGDLNGDGLSDLVAHFAVDGGVTQTAKSDGSKFDSAPTGAVTELAFNVGANDETSTLQCRVVSSGQSWSSCGQLYQSAFGPGQHVVEFRAVDAVGNVDPTPAVREVDIQSPPQAGTVGESFMDDLGALVAMVQPLRSG